MANVQRRLITRDDVAHWDGVTRTSSGVDATGGTVTGLNFGDEVDVLQVFGGGTNRTVATINDAISRLGGANATLLFSTGTWVIDVNLTIPSSIASHIPAGCVFDVSANKTLTFQGPVFRDSVTWTSGSGTVTGGTRSGVLVDTTVAETVASVTPSDFAHNPYVGRRYSSKTVWESITVNIYVATTGSDSNAGETSGAPFATLQKALDTIAMFSTTLPGKWQINVAAGTYSTAANSVSSLRAGTRTVDLIDIVGPDVSGHPNVPTAIFDGTSAGTSPGLRLSLGARVKVKDVKFTTYTGKGISAAVDCLIYTDNVHTDDCNIGIYTEKHCRLYVDGGLFDLVSGNLACIQSTFESVHHIGYRYDEATAGPVAAQDPTLTGDATGRGIYLLESARGHVGAVIDNFVTGVDIVSHSRVHFDSGTDIKNNSLGVSCVQMSTFQDSGITWNTGTGDANTSNFVFRNFGTDLEFGSAITSRIVKKEFLIAAHTGDTDETFRVSLPLTAGAWMSAPGASYEGKVLRVRVYGGITGTAGTKTIRWRVGTADSDATGTAVTSNVIAASPAGAFFHEFEFHIRGGASQRTEQRTIVDGGAIQVGGSSPTVTMTGSADQFMKLTVQLGNGADSISVNEIEFEVVG